MEEAHVGQRNRWLVLVIIGIFAQVLAVVNSDLGLDAHVRLNALNTEGGDGQALTWGPVRIAPDADQFPNSTAQYDGYIPPWSTSEGAMKLTSLTALFGVAALSGFVPFWKPTGRRFNPTWPALILLSPVFLFATGRGYDEPVIALLIGLGACGYFHNKGETLPQVRFHLLALATSLLLVMGWKGFSMLTAFMCWLLTIILGMVWIELQHRSFQRGTMLWLQNPWVMGPGVALLSYGVIFGLGSTSNIGTFSIIATQPLTFLYASLVAALDTVLLFLLIGFALWPFLLPAMRTLRGARGQGLTLLVMFVSGLLAALIAYIAALWTLEASLWNQSLHETMFLLGNNGRYATCLLLPTLLILRWDQVEEEESTVSMKHVCVALLLLLPAILFTSLMGQHHWSQDAGEQLELLLVEGDDTLVLIAPEALAMHHLYVLKTNVDLDGTHGINAYWRTPLDFQSLAEDQSVRIDVLILAPTVELPNGDEQWVLVAEEFAPFTVSNGVSDSSWKIYRPLE